MTSLCQLLARLLVIASVPLAIGSCRQVIGIEEAQIDPSLSAAGSNPEAGSGATNMLPLGNGGAGGDTSSTAGSQATGGNTGGSEASTLGGSAGDVSTAGQAGQGGSSTTPPTLCESYCTAVMENCTGSFAVYTTYETCLAVCASLPEGQAGDQNVDTVHCRLEAATQAKNEVPFYCPIAGPGGNGVCGTNCEALCLLKAAICSEHVPSDVTACAAECAPLEDLGAYSTEISVKHYQGPHIQCRLYHISAAAGEDAETHCRHVAGESPCI